MTTSQEMDAQFGEGEIERRLKDLEDKVRAYEEGGMDIFRQFGYVQLGDQLPRLDPDGITFAAPEAGTGPTTAPDGARLIWRREAFTGDVVADISGAHSTPGGTVDQNALYLRAFKSTDWADVKVGAWDDDVEDWLTVFGVRAATSSTFRLYAEDENDNFFFGVSRTDADNYVLHLRKGGALVDISGGGSMPMPPLVGTDSWHCLGTQLAASANIAPSSQTWTTANAALYMPLLVTEDITVTKLWCLNGAAVSGNVNMALYTSAFAQVANSEIGSTGQLNTNVIQAFDITDVALTAGLYYIAIVLDNTTGTLFHYTTPSAAQMQSWGMAQEAAVFDLPATMTPADVVMNNVPVCGIATRTQVA